MISAARITKEQFEEVLGRYDALMESISDKQKDDYDKSAEYHKQNNPGLIYHGHFYRQNFEEEDRLFGKKYQTLKDLDRFRFEEAPRKYCQPDPTNKDKHLIIPLTLEDLKKLLIWWLRNDHNGRGFPNTPAPVRSMAPAPTPVMSWEFTSMQKILGYTRNLEYSEEKVVDSSKEAFEFYEAESPALDSRQPIPSAKHRSAIEKLSDISGSYPSRAIASLLLSVHDKDNVLYLSHEVNCWLSRSGPKTHPKHQCTSAEYQNLVKEFEELRERLGGETSALEIEKVAYVLMMEEKMKRVKDREEKKESVALNGPVISRSVKRLAEEAGTFCGQIDENDLEPGRPKRTRRAKR